MLPIGKITGEPIGVYHSSDAVSKTKLDVFRRHPELYRKTYITKEIPKPEPTEALIIGNAAGALILEGEKAFKERHIILPEDAPKKPTKKQINAAKPSLDSINAIEWWESFRSDAAGRAILSPDQNKLIYQLEKSLRENPTFAELTRRGTPEVTFRIRGEHFHVQVRPDWWNDDGCALTGGYPYIVDVKTIAELPQDDPEHLGRHIADYGYHRAAYLYPEIVAHALKWSPDLPRPRFFLAFIEKIEPFHSEVVELTEIDVELGQRQVTDALMKLRRCIQTGIWRTTPKEIRQVSLPRYYVRRELEATDVHLAA